jgi:hypothetical protein
LTDQNILEMPGIEPGTLASGRLNWVKKKSA